MRRLLLCFSAVLAGGLVSAQSPQTPQAPTFRSTTSLVLVDVTVLDKDGKPVPGLTANEFQVKLDGQVRAVRAVTYEQIATPLAAPAIALAEPDVTSGAPTRVESARGAPPPAPRRRVIVIMVDDLSLTPQRGKGMFAAAARFVEALPPTDLVGYTTSSQSASMNPTPDHLAVQVALPRLVGQLNDPRQLPGPAVGIDEGIEIQGGDSAQLDQVIIRDCYPGVTPPSDLEGTQCGEDVGRKARAVGSIAEATARRQIQSYLEAVAALHDVPGLKQLVVISDGLALPRRTQVAVALDPLAKTAAAAGVQVTVLSEEPSQSDVEDTDRTLGKTPAGLVLSGQLAGQVRRADDLSLRQGVQTVADLTGGTYYQVVGTADPFFARIALATSAMYELGVEAPDKSAPGRDFALAVHVNRNGLTARANRHALVPEPTAPVPIETQLNQAVASGTPLYGIPISLGTSIRRGESTSQLAVDLDMEIPGSTPGPLTLVFGLADAIGLIRQGRKTIDAPAGGGDYRVSLALPVLAGSYRMRLAVADANGAVGSVETPVKAVLGRIGPFLASDLLTGWSPATGPAQFVALDHLPPTATRLLSVLELYPDAGVAMPSDVRVKVTILTPDETPIDDREVTPQNVNGMLRIEAPFDLQYIPAGPYLLRATVTVGGAAVGTVSTTVRITKASGGAAGRSR